MDNGFDFDFFPFPDTLTWVVSLEEAVLKLLNNLLRVVILRRINS